MQRLAKKLELIVMKEYYHFSRCFRILSLFQNEIDNACHDLKSHLGKTPIFTCWAQAHQLQATKS